MAPLEIVASTIWLEYSYGRFDVGDVGEFRSLLKNLFTSSSTYTYFINCWKNELILLETNLLL